MAAETERPASKPARRVLVQFDVAGQRYAIQSSHIEQITAMAEMQRPPGTPVLLLGFLNLAGELVPVVSLRRLFAHPAAAIDLWAPLIVLKGPNSRLTLLVDNVNRVMAVHESDVLPVSAGHALNDYVEGIVRSAEGSVLVLSPERLLLHQEKQAVAELQQLAEQRSRGLQRVEA